MNIKFICSTLFTTGLLLISTASTANQDKRVTSLWSDHKDCSTEGAMFIAIEDLNNSSFKVAQCAPMGCRIAVREFGKKTHQGSYKDDPRFRWISESEFEAKINGSKRHFYHCFTK